MRRNCVRNASKVRGTPLGRTPFGRYRNHPRCVGNFEVGKKEQSLLGEAIWGAKWLRSDPGGSTHKWLPKGSQVTHQKWLQTRVWVTFDPFRFTLGGRPHRVAWVTFGHFNCFELLRFYMMSQVTASQAPKCSKSRDLTAIAICDSNRESQITSDLRQCDPSQKSSMYWLVVQEIGIAILTAIWTELQITNRAIWKCDLSCSRLRFEGNSCDLGSAISNH